jgi:hypothetical protein
VDPAETLRVAANKAATDEARYTRSRLSLVVPLPLAVGGVRAIYHRLPEAIVGGGHAAARSNA